MSAGPCKVLFDIGFENSLWYLIKFSSTEVLLVGVVYRAPSSSNINNQKLLSIFSQLHDLVKFTHFLIINFPTINWAENYCRGIDTVVL